MTAILLLLSASLASAEGPLTIEGYLKQVREGSKAVQAAQESSEGALLRSRESRLVIAPNLFATLSLGKDGKQSPFPGLTYDHIVSNTYNFGVRQLSPTGTTWEVGYSLAYTNYARFMGGADFPYFEGRPQLRVRQALWRNSFGYETRAEQDAIEAGALAERFSSRFQAKSAMAAAENAYWSLALARENLARTKATLERAVKLLEWSANRAKTGLGDASDELQARAAHELRGLQFQQAKDAERNAARAFNTQRGRPGSDVPETIEPINLEKIQGLKAPRRAARRDDTLAAEQASRAAQARAEQGLSRDHPTVDVIGLVGLNSREATADRAFSQSFALSKPAWGVGLELSVPLFIGVRADARAGWRLERASAEKELDQALLVEEQQWNQLEQGLAEAKARLKLAARIEDAQKRKTEYERGRLNRGRTTTAQVLIFEEDLAQAQLARLGTAAEALSIAAQLKTFEAADEAASETGEKK